MLAALVLLAGCSEETETEYVQYNGDGDAVQVEVGVPTRYVTDDEGSEVAEVVATVLRSSTGAVEIGTGTVDPSAGPIGSVHRVVVQVYDDYATDVDRVAVRTESGERGEDVYELERDSAGEGWWVYELESVGEDGEERTDTFTFLLYEAEESEE